MAQPTRKENKRLLESLEMTWAITWSQPVFRIKFSPGDTLTPEVRSRNTLDEINRNAFYGLVKLPRRCELSEIRKEKNTLAPRQARAAQRRDHSPPTNVGRVGNPGVDAICGLSLLLVLSLAPRGFSSGTPVSPLLKNQQF